MIPFYSSVRSRFSVGGDQNIQALALAVIQTEMQAVAALASRIDH